jgi:hypothetical protein
VAIVQVARRRPVYKHKTRVFVADHREPDGVWVYRQVGTEPL